MKLAIRQILLTSIVFVIVQLFLMFVLHFTAFSYFDLNSWIRWDSGHYLKIAKEGYNYFPCAGNFGYPLNATEMCGNTGWFPAYPFFIKLLSYLVPHSAKIAVFISKLFYFLCLLMITIITQINKISLRNILYLLIAAVFFGFIYYTAVFPISMMLFFSLLSFNYFLKKKTWLLSLCCAIAAMTYPTAFLLSFVMAVALLIQAILSKNYKEIYKSTLPLIGGGIGVGLTFLNFQLEVGDWSAFIQVQSKYNHGFHNPINDLKNLFCDFVYSPPTLNSFIKLQSILVLIGYALLSIIFFVKKQYRVELFLISYLYITLFLIFPWIMGGNLSMYRAESLLLPSVFLLKNLKTSHQVFILFIFLYVGGVMSSLFFNSVLV